MASASGRAPSPGRDWPFAASELSDEFPRGFFIFPTDRGGNQKLQLLRRTSGDSFEKEILDDLGLLG